MNDLPTEIENEIMKKLFLAIFFNDIEKVIEFKNQYPEIYAKKVSFLIDGYVEFDLTNLTFFNQTVWNDNGWNEELMSFIKEHRQRTKQMLDFWRVELGIKNMQQVFKYNQYWNWFYCEDPDDLDIVIDKPISYFLEKGFREIDLRLCNRVECFDFTETKLLLEQGAKSDIDFYKEEDCNAQDRIVTELCYLASCHIVPEFKTFLKKGYNQDFDIEDMFGRLLGLAAYQEMDNLLEMYIEAE